MMSDASYYCVELMNMLKTCILLYYSLLCTQRVIMLEFYCGELRKVKFSSYTHVFSIVHW